MKFKMNNKKHVDTIWYDKYWKAKETPEFNTWYSDFYGDIEDYAIDDREEYYLRKAFALMGWLGRNGEVE